MQSRTTEPESAPGALPLVPSPGWIAWLGHMHERLGMAASMLLWTLVAIAFCIPLGLGLASRLLPGHAAAIALICAAVPAIVAPLLVYAVLRLVGDLKLAQQALQALAHHDPLTRVHNRRHFLGAASLAIRTAQSERQALCVIMVDVDNFKLINDSHGHACGDAVLRAVSDTCTRQLRAHDLFARYGGEEFVALLPGTDAELATAIAERLRRSVESLQLTDAAGQRIAVTASFGVAHLGYPSGSLEQLLQAADHALYRAKRTGRNRVQTQVGCEPGSTDIPDVPAEGAAAAARSTEADRPDEEPQLPQRSAGSIASSLAR